MYFEVLKKNKIKKSLFPSCGQQLKCSGEISAPPMCPVHPSGHNIAPCILSESLLMVYYLTVDIVTAMLYLEVVIFQCESQRFRPVVVSINKIKICKFL